MSFDFNEKPVEFVEGVESFSKTKLKRKIDILRIYEEAQKNGDAELFEDLVFNAKYVMGLLRVVRKSANLTDINNLEQIKKDFSENTEKVIKQLRAVLQNCPDDLKKYFEDTYFKLTQENFINLSELMSDLESAKKYLNEIKRG